MSSDGVQAQVSEVAEAVGERTEELAVMLARTIRREVDLYRTAIPVAFDTVVAGCAANIRPIFTAIAAGSAFDTTAAAELGVERARAGVPLSSVMEAYRVGFRRLWDAVVNELTGRSSPMLSRKVAPLYSVWKRPRRFNSGTTISMKS